jgi:hypothetical protein
MLRRTSQLRGLVLGARDGEIGRVKDFYFDDSRWAVRYLVADTGKWLALRQVLLSPHSVRRIREDDKILEVNLTREQVEKSPPIDHDKPVSRQYEDSYYRYYNFPFYWQGASMWGPMETPVLGVAPPPNVAESRREDPSHSGDAHLRSVVAVTGYHIQALDGELGHVEDFVISDENWAIEYLVVDTVNWWPGKKVLVPPSWASEVDWHGSKLMVNLDRATIKGAPGYDASQPIARDYEAALFRYYNREPYWADRAAA